MRQVSFTVMLILFTGLFAMAQIDEEFSGIEVLLRKEHFGGAFINSAGGGIEFRKGTNSNFYTKWLYEANLLEIKASRETRVYNPLFRNSRSYVYGKLNNLYIIRAGGGQQKLINRKPYWGGVEVRYFWFAGASVGFTKPVYLYIIKELAVSQFFYEYSLVAEKYDPDNHFLDNIYGRGPFTKGFESLKIHPGAYAKAGFSFDFSRQNEKISAVELGASLDVFPSGVPIMAFRNPERYFLTLFLGYYFGKRYN
jgi:hypothetical protein